LAYWLADQILSEEKTKSQLKAFQHLVILGKHLLELQNFNSLFAVYLALNLKAVKSLRIDCAFLLPFLSFFSALFILLSVLLFAGLSW